MFTCQCLAPSGIKIALLQNDTVAFQLNQDVFDIRFAIVNREDGKDQRAFHAGGAPAHSRPASFSLLQEIYRFTFQNEPAELYFLPKLMNQRTTKRLVSRIKPSPKRHELHSRHLRLQSAGEEAFLGGEFERMVFLFRTQKRQQKTTNLRFGHFQILNVFVCSPILAGQSHPNPTAFSF